MSHPVTCSLTTADLVQNLLAGRGRLFFNLQMSLQPYHVQLASKRASNWADSTDEVVFTLGAVSDAAPKEGEPGEPDKARCSRFA